MASSANPCASTLKLTVLPRAALATGTLTRKVKLDTAVCIRTPDVLGTPLSAGKASVPPVCP